MAESGHDAEIVLPPARPEKTIAHADRENHCGEWNGDFP